MATDGETAITAIEASEPEDAVNEAENEAAGEELVDAGELDALEFDTIETPLADVDEAALEAGIASVFDSIRAEGIHVPANDDADTPYEEGADVTAEDEADRTVALLAELNRLWAQPLAA